MIDHRILKLLNAPEDILVEDLAVVKAEINKYPYIQSMRALYLYGAHRYDKDTYQGLLTETAAYTTDKKILYQFINKENIVKQKEQDQHADDKKVDVANSNGTILKSKFENVKTTFPNIKLQDEISDVSAELDANDVVLTPILDSPIVEESNESIEEAVNIESEIENSAIDNNIDKVEEEIIDTVIEIEDDNEEEIVVEEEEEVVIDTDDILTDEKLHESLEENIDILNDASLATEDKKVDNEWVDSKIETKLPYEISIAEPIVNKQDVVSDEPKVDLSQLSFHENFDHLPKIKIQSVKEEYIVEAPKQNPERHLTEIERLIAEVEAKMKSKKATNSQENKFVEDVKDCNVDISFSENYDTLNEIKPIEAKDEKEAVQEEIIEIKSQSEDIVKQTEVQENTNWKPLQVENKTPDALIKLEKEKSSSDIPNQNSVEDKATVTDNNSLVKITTKETVIEKEERPVINVSFFSNTVEPIPTNEPEKNSAVEVKHQSNVPHFINTWQNWLKVDKKSSVLLESSNEDVSDNDVEQKEEVKAKAIEVFIENNPKISKLKEETDFVVKDKGENISHLMTETLAGLYVQQKLYTKAIGAYQILKEKYPEKESYFEQKIQVVKEMRSGK